MNPGAGTQCPSCPAQLDSTVTKEPRGLQIVHLTCKLCIFELYIDPWLQVVTHYTDPKNGIPNCRFCGLAHGAHTTVLKGVALPHQDDTINRQRYDAWVQRNHNAIMVNMSNDNSNVVRADCGHVGEYEVAVWKHGNYEQKVRTGWVSCPICMKQYKQEHAHTKNSPDGTTLIADPDVVYRDTSGRLFEWNHNTKSFMCYNPSGNRHEATHNIATSELIAGRWKMSHSFGDKPSEDRIFRMERWSRPYEIKVQEKKKRRLHVIPAFRAFQHTCKTWCTRMKPLNVPDGIEAFCPHCKVFWNVRANTEVMYYHDDQVAGDGSLKTVDSSRIEDERAKEAVEWIDSVSKVMGANSNPLKDVFIAKIQEAKMQGYRPNQIIADEFTINEARTFTNEVLNNIDVYGQAFVRRQKNGR